MANVIADLCIYILTWNVGNNYPGEIDLGNALALNTSLCQNGPDIYAIGFQEINAAPKNQIMDLFRDNEWTLKVGDYLNKAGYVKVATEKMQGILINMWSLPDHIPHMKSIESQTTATGIAGVLGNKGAVSIRLSLYGAGVVFLVAHLAAHDEKLRERVDDFNKIVNKHRYDARNYTAIFDHDFVFWFGDLNFRLNTKESHEEIRSAVQDGRLEELFAKDQLLLVRETGNAFSHMIEEQPTFPPTYKFIKGSNDYNLERRPAWCDRILYRVQTDKYTDIHLELNQLSYTSHPLYTLSDHKPVSGQFRLRIETNLGVDDTELYEMTHGCGQSISASVIILLFVQFAFL